MNTAINQALNWADYFIIAIILFSTLISIMRGFISEAISLLTWVTSVFMALKFTGVVSKAFENIIHTANARIIVSFLLIFIIVLIIGSLINHFLGILVANTGLSGTNRLLGMVFGFARGILLIAILILFAKMTSFIKTPWWKNSQLIPYFLDIVNWLQQIIPAHLNNMSQYFSNPKTGSP